MPLCQARRIIPKTTTKPQTTKITFFIFSPPHIELFGACRANEVCIFASLDGDFLGQHPAFQSQDLIYQMKVIFVINYFTRIPKEGDDPRNESVTHMYHSRDLSTGKIN